MLVSGEYLSVVSLSMHDVIAVHFRSGGGHALRVYTKRRGCSDAIINKFTYYFWERMGLRVEPRQHSLTLGELPKCTVPRTPRLPGSARKGSSISAFQAHFGILMLIFDHFFFNHDAHFFPEKRN